MTEAADPALTSVKADSLGWAATFSQHYPVMYAAAASVLKGQTALGIDADDIVSIALGEAITKGFPADVEQLHSYLARIARLRAIDAVRRRKHQADEPPDPATEAPARITPEGPEELAVQAELASEMAAHLAGLPERERIALESTVMRDREGSKNSMRLLRMDGRIQTERHSDGRGAGARLGREDGAAPGGPPV